MKKTDYDAKLKRAEQHLLAKQYPKALSEFMALNKSDKPLGVKLGLPDRIEKLQGLVREQGFLSIRGLGVITVEALNKKNQFQEIYRVPITKQVDEKGNDIHPLRLPAIVRTSFIKATSEGWLQKEVDLFKENGIEKDVSDRDKVIEKLSADLKKAEDKIIELKKVEDKI